MNFETTRLRRLLGGLTIALTGLSAGPSAAQQETVLPSELEPGARGYGLSVFTGTEPDRFDVEVLGLMRNSDPATDFILARLSGKGLEESGVVAGMSGSPVYLDGKLAGAVAFSWSFSTGAIAGITPIASMREITAFPGAAPSVPAPRVDLASILTPDLGPADLERELDRLASSFGRVGRSPLAWASVGFEDAVRTRLAKTFGAVTPAGTAPDLDAELAGGSAVAGVLIDGDLRLAFTGTVTERDGDDVLAFGHSFLGLGPVELPMATAEIVTVISSLQSSFKLANIGPVVGSFEQDRFAGMLGRVGGVAPTIPFEIRLLGEPEKTYHMELADLPMMTPNLVITAILQVLDTARQLNGDQDLGLAIRVDMKGHDPLLIRQSFEGSSASISSAIYALQLMSFLVHNRDEDVEIEGIEIEIDQSPRPQSVTLLAAHPDRRTVHPGDDLSIHLDVREYRGTTYRESVPITIPDDAPPGTYYLFLGDGASVDALRLQMEPNSPTSFRESLDLMRSMHSSQDFVILGVAAGRGLVVNGTTLPDLPASMQSIWRASGPLAAKAINLSIRQESVQTLSQPLLGAARIDLRVRARTDD